MDKVTQLNASAHEIRLLRDRLVKHPNAEYLPNGDLFIGGDSFEGDNDLRICVKPDGTIMLGSSG
jgi:hypothetical protein